MWEEIVLKWTNNINALIVCHTDHPKLKVPKKTKHVLASWYGKHNKVQSQAILSQTQTSNNTLLFSLRQTIYPERFHISLDCTKALGKCFIAPLLSS